jgi:hypothetical protein
VETQKRRVSLKITRALLTRTRPEREKTHLQVLSSEGERAERRLPLAAHFPPWNFWQWSGSYPKVSRRNSAVADSGCYPILELRLVVCSCATEKPVDGCVL